MAKKGKHGGRKVQCPICRKPQASAQWCANCKAMGRLITAVLRDPDPVPEAAAREALHLARGRRVRDATGR